MKLYIYMEKEKLEDLIKQGLTNKEIAKELNLPLGTLRNRLRKYGLNRFNQKERIITDDDRLKIIKLYGENFTCEEIAAKLVIYRITVSNALKKSGVQIEKRQPENKRNEIANRNKDCSICNKPVGRRANICMSCYTNTRRFKIKKWMIEYKGGKCIDCGVDNLDISCYDFHHLDPNEKDFNLSSLNSARISLEKVKKELDKCDLLCANCHRTKHSNYKNEKLLNYVSNLKVNFLK